MKPWQPNKKLLTEYDLKARTLTGRIRNERRALSAVMATDLIIMMMILKAEIEQ